MDKKLLHLGLNLGPFTPNPHTLPSELSGTMKIFEGNDVYIQILNSDYLSTSPHFQKSDSVKPTKLKSQKKSVFVRKMKVKTLTVQISRATENFAAKTHGEASYINASN